MSYRLHVFLRSREPVTRHAIAGFIKDGVFFNGSVSVEPPPSLPQSREPGWDAMLIRYDIRKRPIVVRRVAAPDAVDDEVSDVLAWIEAAPPSQRLTDSAQKIVQTRQVLSFEVDRQELPEEAWHMLDALEAWLAQSHHGLIWAEDEGIFDENLQPLLRRT